MIKTAMKKEKWLFSKEEKPTPASEAIRVWKDKFNHYNQADFAASMNLRASKLSEMLNNKKEFPLRVIRYLVASGADAEIMIKTNILKK